MFGKRSGTATAEAPRPPRVEPKADAAAPPPAATTELPPKAAAPAPAKPAAGKAAAAARPEKSAPPKTAIIDTRTDDYYQIKQTIFSALIDTIDLAQLAQLDPDSAREEIRDIVNEIISIKAVVMSIAEQEALLQDI
jgi:pilus assembly protein CpaF